MEEVTLLVWIAPHNLRHTNTFLAFETKIRGLLIEVDQLLKAKMKCHANKVAKY